MSRRQREGPGTGNQRSPAASNNSVSLDVTPQITSKANLATIKPSERATTHPLDGGLEGGGLGDGRDGAVGPVAARFGRRHRRGAVAGQRGRRGGSRRGDRHEPTAREQPRPPERRGRADDRRNAAAQQESHRARAGSLLHACGAPVQLRVACGAPVKILEWSESV